MKPSNISSIQEYYLIGELNINLLSGNETLLKKQRYVSYNHASALIWKYMDLCSSHSLNQLITEPAITTERTKTLHNTFVKLSEHYEFETKWTIRDFTKVEKYYWDEVFVEHLLSIECPEYS